MAKPTDLKSQARFSSLFIFGVLVSCVLQMFITTTLDAGINMAIKGQIPGCFRGDSY